MKIRILLIITLSALCCQIFLSGCATSSRPVRTFFEFKTNDVGYIEVAPNPSVNAVLGTLRDANSASAPFNPFAGAINLVLLGASSLMTLAAGYYRNKLNAENRALRTIVLGVENSEPEASKTVKAKVSELATRLGPKVETAVNLAVQREINK